MDFVLDKPRILLFFPSVKSLLLWFMFQKISKKLYLTHCKYKQAQAKAHLNLYFILLYLQSTLSNTWICCFKKKTEATPVPLQQFCWLHSVFKWREHQNYHLVLLETQAFCRRLRNWRLARRVIQHRLTLVPVQTAPALSESWQTRLEHSCLLDLSLWMSRNIRLRKSSQTRTMSLRLFLSLLWI